MPLTIRSAKLADKDVIAGYNVAMAGETEAIRLDLDRVRRGVEAVLADPAKGFYTVAEADGRVIGQAMVTFEWSDWRNGVFWWLQSVYVDPAHRGRGVFRSIYEHLLERARADGGVCGIRLYVERENEPAQAAYRRLGMEATVYQMFEVDFVLER